MVRLNKRLDPSQTGSEAEKLFGDLSKRLVGQDEAIDQIVNIYQMYLAGMNSPGRPIGNFLFLGPTGTGKTRMVEATAESLIGDLRAMIKIDCAEFQHSHEIAKLIGSPPGYLGHRETHPLLSQEALNQYHTEKIKLFDLLGAERIGMKLTESCAMLPAASVSGLYLSHPQARYFMLGRIGRDQLEHYASRKAQSVDQTARWLAEHLEDEKEPMTSQG